MNEAVAKNWRSGSAERAIALMAKPETARECARLEGSGRPGKPQWTSSAAKWTKSAGRERLLAKRDAEQQRAFATAYMVTIFGGGATLIVATLMGVLLTRSIAVPITRMTSTMATLAKGDTTIEVLWSAGGATKSARWRRRPRFSATT
jgi:methyl-accepting chemotaxis protein